MTPTTTGLADVHGLQLAYEDYGRADAPVILLIMGLGAQLIYWPEALVENLVHRGFRVVRFDNRDIGLSTKLVSAKPPRLVPLMLAAQVGIKLPVPYKLDDMARDTVGLMRALGIDRAHVVGASMGGMIAQIVAARYPERLLTLTSVMSTSGARGLARPSAELIRKLTKPRAMLGSRELMVEQGMDVLRAIGTPGGRDDAERRKLVERAIDRNVETDGPRRQTAAIVASGSRAALLPRIKAPTLVIHGTADRLVPPDGAADTAKRIPGARLEWMDGMGHDLPAAYLPRLASLIAAHAGG